MDSRAFNQLLEVLKDINRTLKRISDEIARPPAYCCDDPNQTDETKKAEEE